MKISTEIGSAARICGEEKAVEQIAKAGFDAWDLSMFSMYSYDWKNSCRVFTGHPLEGREYLSFARKLRQIGEDNGIVCNQSHAPFPVFLPGMEDCLKRAIECTAEAGGKICVIHPDNNKTPEENAGMYHRLLPFAKDCGVKIATENMWNWYDDHAQPAACSDPESFLAHLLAVNDPDFCACLDLGHAEMRGLNTTAPEMILALGEHLQALHVHDNDRWHDSHQIPFSMQMDFAAVANALQQIGYRGYVTLEADSYLKSVDATPESVLSGLQNMAFAAKKLAKMIENDES